MLYIHKLTDLNPKSADIESLLIIRDIKKRNKLPLSNKKIAEELVVYFFSRTDIEAMSKALELIPKTVQSTVDLSKKSRSCEPINLQRTCNALKEIEVPLKKEIEYVNLIFELQNLINNELADFFNTIPGLKNQDEKKMCNEKISAMFSVILRDESYFSFKFDDIINEAHIERVNFLEKGMKEGFFFHVKIDEYLRKDDISKIRVRIPENELKDAEEIAKNIDEIKKGVGRAYEGNMRMINLAVVLYSYIKWLSGL